ncbi:HAMP domain-containing sensor histidine kinase [Ruminococcus sp. YE78]|uniref:sensor histidine kinase n=1 Tax=Ruminococcus sp. YE78 TaxID=1352374 RepID=UPI0008894F5C|nr:HAMP domain-containing sensor histidine kinase [Ruminococcus sp. YE78]SDA14089.1 Signal transduction histidine kinase [Ruminococcus sp. YE78]
MEMILATACECLFVFLCALLWKYISLKKNIRHFSQELEKLKSSDYRQPVKVTDFDKDLVELAVKVNEHTDIQRQLGVEYEERQKQLGTVISGISHDFRTPLTASLGYLQMIEKSGELSDKNAEYLTIVMQKNKYLKELSDEFFELTKIENSNDELQLEEVNLSNLLTEAVLEQHSWIADKNIATDFEISDGIMIQADVHCLTRILNNLMSNAQKYTSDSFGVKLKQDGNCVVLCVSNTIADSTSLDVDRVFEPFYRMDARTEGGSGLGLYVVKLLCDRLGWSVKAELNDNVFTATILI